MTYALRSETLPHGTVLTMDMTKPFPCAMEPHGSVSGLANCSCTDFRKPCQPEVNNRNMLAAEPEWWRMCKRK